VECICKIFYLVLVGSLCFIILDRSTFHGRMRIHIVCIGKIIYLLHLVFVGRGVAPHEMQRDKVGCTL
jgi:hypothetical protein